MARNRAPFAAVTAAAIAATAGEPTPPCEPSLNAAVLPTWARAGFSDPEPRVPHAIGRENEIAAILFADQLTTPPTPPTRNKILWVARRPLDAPSDLRIQAQRMEEDDKRGDPVNRVVENGPGPSTVDLPEPRCWRLTLRWAERVDTLDLRYRARSALSG